MDKIERAHSVFGDHSCAVQTSSAFHLFVIGYGAFFEYASNIPARPLFLRLDAVAEAAKRLGRGKLYFLGFDATMTCPPRVVATFVHFNGSVVSFDYPSIVSTAVEAFAVLLLPRFPRGFAFA
jgi:hypothetical protein